MFEKSIDFKKRQKRFESFITSTQQLRYILSFYFKSLELFFVSQLYLVKNTFCSFEDKNKNCFYKIFDNFS